ncbi:MAG: helix-turn-helix transcriptional regulator [Bacilli bacterium]|nr:helix-turn-helix transcriptional regulator [Bacilli bacterium]
MEFKDNLKSLREKRKLTQDYVAEKIGISRQSVSKWENGDSEPNLATIKKLCEILSCNISELVSENKEEKPESSFFLDVGVYALIASIGALFIVSGVVFMSIFLTNVIQSVIIQNSGNSGIAGIGAFFYSKDIVDMTIKYASLQGVTITAESDTYIPWQNSLLTKYTLHGDLYVYNMVPYDKMIIHWVYLVLSISFFSIGVPSTIISYRKVKDK